MTSKYKHEDDDYMSDKILENCPNTRPGLVPSHLARQHKIERKAKILNQTNRMKPRKVLEAENLEDGLGKALDSSNKGFAMLQKMGFKPGLGVGLGKSGSGLAEPISINLRPGRSGLGHETETQRKRNAAEAHKKAQAAKRQKMAEQRQDKFQSQQSERFFEKLATKDLYKSQRVCEQLDSQKGMTEPAEPFFWPKNLLPIKDEDDAKKRRNFEDEDDGDDEKDEQGSGEEEEEEEEEEELLTPAEKLEILTMYLRNRHMYCVWCGTTFSDKKDLADNCPGNTAEAHND